LTVIDALPFRPATSCSSCPTPCEVNTRSSTQECDIGQLAPHERAKNAGELLVADAVKRVLAASESVAVYAIVFDAKDDRGRQFYAAHGFISLPSRPNRLFLLAETALAALAASAREQREGG
jgi:hypothetical protein